MVRYVQRSNPSTAKVPAPRFRLPCDSGRRDPPLNERFTALAAIPLFVLLAVEGITLLFLRPLLSVHVFVGMLLVLPVGLKLATTGWRFLRYYRRDPEYVRRGPPQIVMRLLAPVLVLSTLMVLGTGIALVFLPSHSNLLLLLHKASFVVWGPIFGLHVLVYLWRVPRLVVASLGVQRAATIGVLLLAAVGATLGYVDGHPALGGWFHHDFNRDGDRF